MYPTDFDTFYRVCGNLKRTFNGSDESTYYYEKGFRRASYDLAGNELSCSFWLYH